MPKERVVDGKTFTYTGIVEFKKLYSQLKEFWDSKGFDFLEKSHEEKLSDDGSRSFKVVWSCEKKVTDYAKYVYEITISAEKIKLSQGGKEYIENFKILINGDLEFDYGKYFGDKPFNMFLRALFEKYIASGEIKEHKKKISQIAEDFIKLAMDLTASYKL